MKKLCVSLSTYRKFVAGSMWLQQLGGERDEAWSSLCCLWNWIVKTKKSILIYIVSLLASKPA